MPDTNTTTNPNRLTPWRSPTPTQVLAFYRTGKWEPPPDKVGRIRAELAAGTYESEHKMNVAARRLLDDLTKPNIADAIAQQMDQEHGDEQRGDRENFGCSADEEAEWERRNVGDRFE